MSDKLGQEITRRLMSKSNADLRRMIQSIMPRSPRYRFYQNKETKDRYFYTIEKIIHKNKPRYVAGIYRYLKTKKQFKLVKKVGFSKKYKAKNKAYSLYLKEKDPSPEKS